jgi:hypothetical protein
MTPAVEDSAISRRRGDCSLRKISASRANSFDICAGMLVALSMTTRTMYRRPSTLLPDDREPGRRRRPVSGGPMFEERFDRIEQRLDRLETGQGELMTGQVALLGRQDGLETGLARLQAGQDALLGRQDALETGQARLTAGLDDLHHQMLILHEKVMDQIKAIPDPVPQLERMMDTKIEGLREEIGRRLDPLEAVVRRHFGT